MTLSAMLAVKLTDWWLRSNLNREIAAMDMLKIAQAAHHRSGDRNPTEIVGDCFNASTDTYLPAR
jgi:hypothetical protein